MRQRILLLFAGALLLGLAVLLYVGRSSLDPGRGETKRPTFVNEETRLASVHLYFGDPLRVGFRVETRVTASGSTFDERAAACVRELAGGSLEGAWPVLPERTRLHHAYVDRWGVAYLDLDRAILAVRGDGREWLAVGALVQTICANFPEVRALRFMVDGNLVSTFKGTIDLEEPLAPEDFASPAGAEL